MSQETLLAFDFGEKKIGVAIGNSLLRIASPLEIILSEIRTIRFNRINQLLKKWMPDRVIVGLSINNISESDRLSKQRCCRFANQLRAYYKLRVELVDEFASSCEAQEILGNNHHDDALAASVILQRYLNSI
ncbi:MAG: Holliday junction resolvase RuvX [Bordetella sp.]|nr:MAG: Holliday junction resolvase RuvX [Bordetella sp.]